MCFHLHFSFVVTGLFIAIGRPDIVQISTEEQISPIVLSGFPDTLLMPQTKPVQNIDVTTGTCNNLYCLFYVAAKSNFRAPRRH
jgi:hypothetical protein